MTTDDDLPTSDAAGATGAPEGADDAAPGPENPGSAAPDPENPDGAAPDPENPDGAAPAGSAFVEGLQRRIGGLISFAQRRLQGDYEIDEFGYDADFVETLLVPPLKWLLTEYFRAEILGVENIPFDTGALLVANHSGTIAIDAVMTAVAVHQADPRHEPLRMLGADLVFDTPILGPLARRAGSTVACREDAERLLAAGKLVGVFPEGFKGVGKNFAQRYQLQRFGRGGFVAAALRTGAPIVPVSIVGAEEAYPMLGSIDPLARVLGLPYFPITPTFPALGPLGAIPLPSRWIIEFGEPIATSDVEASAADDPMLVFNLADRVRETIQQSLYRLLLRRGHPFIG